MSDVTISHETTSAPEDTTARAHDATRGLLSALPRVRRKLNGLGHGGAGSYGSPVGGRGGALITRGFEDVVPRLVQQTAKTPITALLLIGWDTVGKIVARVVAENLDENRLAGLISIGVDEISCAPRGAINPGGMRGPPPAAAMAG